MTYTQTTWADDTPPPISGANLNKMESGINAAHPVVSIADLKNVSLTGLINNDHRFVLGYYAAGDGGDGLFRWNAASTASDNGGTIIIPASSPSTGRWERVLGQPSLFNVRHFGAKGIGSSGASSDQSAFSAAITAAGNFGIVYIPAGDYFVTGSFTLGQATRIRGASLENTTINHTGNNVLFTSTFNVWGVADPGWNSGSRAFTDFNIIGNTGASAKGILEGNSYKAEFRNLRVRAYTNGTGIELSNTVSWTEGAGFYNVQVRYCSKGFALSVNGGSSSSLAETRFVDCVASVNVSGHVALYIGPNVRLYGGVLSFKINVEHATGIGMQVNTNAHLDDNLYSIFIENFQAMTAATMLTTASGTALRGRGVIWPPPSTEAQTPTTLQQLCQIDPTTYLELEAAHGDQILTSNPASNQYYHVATLPASSGTRDKLVVEIIGGPFWNSSALVYDRVIMSNNTVFAYQYERTGPDAGGSRGDLRVRALSQGSGTVEVYITAAAGTFSASMVRAYGTGIGNITSPTAFEVARRFPVKPPTTTAPSGTIVFDSGDSTTYPPNLSREIGSLKVNGWSVNGGPRASQTIATSGTISLGTSGERVIPVTTGGAVTGVVMAAGAFDGQVVYVVNRSANTLTFNTTQATSRVAESTASIGANRGLALIWDANYGGTGTGRWARLMNTV